MKYLVGIISVLVVVVLVGSVMVPIINDSTGGGVEYEDNPDWAGWVRFDLNTVAGATYHLGMSQDENGIYVENITADSRDTQIYDDSATVDYETIMYADSNMVVWSIDDTFNVQGISDGRPVFINAPILDIVRSADGVDVTTDTDSVVFDSPSWAYVPHSGGKYGFYPYAEDRGVEHPVNAPTAVLGGGFAGVYAYNNIYTYNGLGLVMNPIVEDGLYYGATWEKPAADEGEFDPDDITINPLDPSVIDGGDDPGIAPYNPPIVIDDPFEPDAELMTVPTPTYSDGAWGYDLTTVDGVTKALIVSYSGTGGDIVVPATIGGYDVYRLGKAAPTSSSSYNVFDDSLLSENSTITIPYGIVEIGARAFNHITKITGSLVIPSSVTAIGNNAFNGCTGFTGSLVIPSAVTYIGSSAFIGCTGFTGSLVIPSSVTTISGGAFQNNTGISQCIIASDATPGNGYSLNASNATEVLDLSDTVDYSVDRYGINAGAEVSDSIGNCFGFVSIVSIAHGTPGGMGEYSNLIYAIPIVIISALLVAFGVFVIRRDY